MTKFINTIYKNFVKIISFKSNPYSYINQSDILVLTSLHEGLPNILIEAAVLKTFVISKVIAKLDQKKYF